jgi:hypothetical protein
MPLLRRGEIELMRDSTKVWRVFHLKKYYHGKGTLILTNRRLIFEKMTGLISRKVETEEISFLLIKNVTTQGLLSKKLVVEEAGQYIFKVSDAGQWAVQLRSAIQEYVG